MTRVAVVVPAHDEQALLPGCLAAVRRAAALVDLPVEVVVALDACTDRSAAMARAAGAATVTLAARSVGAARCAGAAYALRDGASGLWLATTDADTRPPPGWLAGQLRHARAGAELVVGTVAVDDWSPWPAGLPAAYRAAYGAAGHAHVHGANLGMTAAAYRRVGGFAALPLDEDRALVRAAHRAGARVVYATDIPVVTSARPVARAAGGFSRYLHRLAGRLHAAPVAAPPDACHPDPALP